MPESQRDRKIDPGLFDTLSMASRFTTCFIVPAEGADAISMDETDFKDVSLITERSGSMIIEDFMNGTTYSSRTKGFSYLEIL